MSRFIAPLLFSVGVVFAGWAGGASAQISMDYSEISTADAASRLLVLVDSSGNVIGQLLASNGVETGGVAVDAVDVTVATYTSAPPGVTMSTLAPPFTPTPSTATVRVPRSLMLGYCVSGSTYYDKRTGKCADGNFPWKMVPLGAASNPAAKTPTVVCPAPRVPTFSGGTSKWSCIVPTGFKVSM